MREREKESERVYVCVHIRGKEKEREKKTEGRNRRRVCGTRGEKSGMTNAVCRAPAKGSRDKDERGNGKGSGGSR